MSRILCFFLCHRNASNPKDPRDFSVGISGCARAALWQDASVLFATMHAGKVYPNVSPVAAFRCICFEVVREIFLNCKEEHVENPWDFGVTYSNSLRLVVLKIVLSCLLCFHCNQYIYIYI